jgi:hypothetical protein
MYSLSATVDKIIFEHKLLHGQLFKWIRWNNQEAAKKGDGIPADCLELSFMNKIFFRIISSWSVMSFLNMFGLSSIIGRVNSGLLKNASAIGLIVMDNASKSDYLNAGRYFERIWLTATSLGLAFHPFGGIPFLITRILQAKNEGFSNKHYETLVSAYNKLLDIFPIKKNNALIILFRIGYAKKPAARTFRRPLSEVMCKMENSIESR